MARDTCIQKFNCYTEEDHNGRNVVYIKNIFEILLQDICDKFGLQLPMF